MSTPSNDTSPPALKWPLLIVVFLIAAAFLIWGAFSSSRSGKSQLLVPTSETTAPNPKNIKVHVIGEVNKPGLYEFRPDERVEDAIARAGGATPNANINAVNLSAFLEDGLQVKVPASSPPTASPPTAAPPTPSSQTVIRKTPNDFVRNPLNLNTATRAELEELPEVGPGTADYILALRARKGKFTSVEELSEVPWLGERTMEKLRPLVVVN